MKGDVGRAISLLGDAVSGATLDQAELEITKQEVAGEHERNHTEYEGTTLQQCHYNCFRDHMMGQPTRGDPDTLQNITTDVLSQYRAANYFGDNLVIVGTGGVGDHDSFVEQVEGAFSSIAKTSSAERANGDSCIFTPSLMMIRDDDMINANVGVFYDAPGYKHEDFFAFTLLKYMFG
jgi:processing peptidase subunit beta